MYSIVHDENTTNRTSEGGQRPTASEAVAAITVFQAPTRPGPLSCKVESKTTLSTARP